MTKDVLVYVTGMHIAEEKEEPITLVTVGTYYYKNKKHFIFYDELNEAGGVMKNTIKIAPDMVDVIRKGEASSHMVFEIGKENLSYYDTPYGSMLMGITTSNFSFKEINERHMELKIDYTLSIDGKHVSDCSIEIKIKAKNE